MTGIAITIVILSIVCFVVGWIVFQKNYKIYGVSMLMLAGGLLIGFGENPVNNAYRSNAGMIVLGIIVSAVSIVMMIIQLVNAGKSNRIRVTQLAEEKKIAFYNECVKNGIQECKSEKEIQCYSHSLLT